MNLILERLRDDGKYHNAVQSVIDKIEKNTKAPTSFEVGAFM